MMRRYLLAAAAGLALAVPAPSFSARAEEDNLPPITEPRVVQECGACHMAFPPQFLPQRSWQKIMDTLPDHFGEDASLAEADRQAILGYLLANAADAPDVGWRGILRGVPEDATPLRITEFPWWVREHDEVRAARWASPEIGSKANCAACHRGAAQGVFEDD
jgi:mono/diheme cytochrome c family protein